LANCPSFAKIKNQTERSENGGTMRKREQKKAELTKGEQTRETIIARAAPLFNRQGYYAASMADIMAATGLQKGGIYNHFANKDELALAAFEYNWQQIRKQVMRAMQAAGVSPLAQLLAALQIYNQAGTATLPPGGCPVLNTAIETDDGHPLLRERVQQALDEWRALWRQTLAVGIAQGEFQPDLQLDEVATVLISTLEGGVMLSQLYKDPIHLQRVVRHLQMYLQTLQRTST